MMGNSDKNDGKQLIDCNSMYSTNDGDSLPHNRLKWMKTMEFLMMFDVWNAADDVVREEGKGWTTQLGPRRDKVNGDRCMGMMGLPTGRWGAWGRSFPTWKVLMN